MLDSINGITENKVTGFIDENLFEQIHYYGKSHKSCLIENDNIIKFISDIPLPFFNCVLYYNLNPDALREELRSFKEYGISKKTSLLWLKGPSSLPKGIEDILAGEKFEYDDHMIGMAIDIDRLNPGDCDIRDFRIEVVRNRDNLYEWVQACLRGFDENGKNFQKIYEFEESLGVGEELPWVRFTGFAGNKAVATSAVFMGSKTVGLDNVTTIPGWRKKGIGALMVRYALYYARSAGYKVGVLQASDMGFNLYRYLGFRDFAESKEYIWRIGVGTQEG